MTITRNKLLAFLLIIALAFSVCALSASVAHAKEANKVTLSASKKAVKVLDTIDNGDFGTTKYSYNSNGLISKVVSGNDYYPYTLNYKYSGAKIVSAKGSDKSSIKAVYKGGRISKVTYKYPEYGNLSLVENYTYKKGRVSKLVAKKGTAPHVLISYDKKGRPTTVTQKFAITAKKSQTYKTTYSYDSKGYVKKVVDKVGSQKTTTTYKNTYTGSTRTACKVYQGGQLLQSITYTYKTIMVPKKYASKVQAQQKAIFYSYGKDENPLFFNI